MKIKILILLLALNLFSCKGIAQEKDSEKNKVENPENAPKIEFSKYLLGENDLPKLKRGIYDYEHLLSLEEYAKLALVISEFEIETSNRINILSVKSIGNYKDFEQFLTELSDYNELTSKGKVVTMILSKELNEIRIIKGAKTEKNLTNKICDNIINQIIIPEFKSGNYFNAMENGVLELIDKWK